MESSSPDHLGRLVAVDAFCATVPEPDDAFGRLADDGVVRGFDNIRQQRQALFGLVMPDLGVAQSGDSRPQARVLASQGVYGLLRVRLRCAHGR